MGQHPAISERKVAACVFVAALALYTLTAGGGLTSTDAVVTFDLTRSLVERHSIALSDDSLVTTANRGTDGRYYSHFGIGQSLYNIPFFVAGRAVARLMPARIGKPDTVPKAAVALGSAVAAAAAAAFVWMLAFRISGDPRSALLASASAAIASPLWPYSKFGFSTALTAAILTGAALCCWTAAAERRVGGAWACGAVVAFGWLTRHELALVLLPLSAFLWVEGRQRGSDTRTIGGHQIALIGAAGIGGVLWMAYNIIRFGNPAAVGYVPGFSVAGYAAFLVAPAASVILFCPIAFLWVRRLIGTVSGRPGAAILLGGPLLVFYLFYGALADWPGGRSYGPRYLVPSLVLLAPALALSRSRRTYVWAAVVLAAALQLPGVLVDYSKVSVDWARLATPAQLQERNWRIVSSPFFLNVRAARERVPENVSYLLGRAPLPPIHETGTSEDREFAQQFSFSLDFWWLYLMYLRALGRASAVGIAAALAFISMWAAFTAGRAADTLSTANHDLKGGSP